MWIYKITVLISLCIILKGEPIYEAVNCMKKYISQFQGKMNPQIYEIFKNSFTNTMSTTVKNFNSTKGKQSTYIITGDIQAMWLRDSTNQFLPYIRMPTDCPYIKEMAKGLINTQSELIMIDTYTNAFKKFEQEKSQRHFYLNDKTETLFFGIPVDLCLRKEYATKHIWERKFEIDSLASFLRLLYQYQNKYKTIDFISINVLKAIQRILTVIEEQTKDISFEKNIKKNFYTFYRDSKELQGGKIKQSTKTGMIKTGFRPSDDANDMAYNIPGNAMLSTYMKLVSQIFDKIPQKSVFSSFSSNLKKKMKMISSDIEDAIYKYGVVNVKGKQIFAYEVNGKGDFKTFDDANLPSVLSLPYLQFVSQKNPIYQETRSFLLSKANPYYFKSRNGDIKGIGSSHTPSGNIWPLALMTQILTSTNDEQIKNCLNSLVKSAKNNLMHQSFSVENPNSITREWFAWANSFFGEMIIKVASQRPHLLI